MDLGECSKIHDIALVADYNNASKTHDYFYDVDVCHTDFFRAMRCISAAYAVMRCLCVCLCVCHVRELCQKE